MKQLHIPLHAVLPLLLSLLIPLASSAYSFQAGDIYYNITNSSFKTVEVTYYSKTSNTYKGDIEIPAEVKYNGSTYKVSAIGDYAFSKCFSLNTVIVPSSVSSIGAYAFESSTIKSITIPTSVSQIADYCFQYCFSLKTISLPTSITSIGQRSFSNCNGLSSITLPENLVTIGREAFLGCGGLKFFSIPASVYSVGWSAFTSCSFDELRIEDGNTTLRFDTGAFNNTKISKLYVGRNWTYGSSSETAFPTTITHLTIGPKVTAFPNGAFSGCSKLQSVIIPPSVKTVGTSAFNNCTGLKKSAYPKTLSNPVIFGLKILYDPQNVLFEDGIIYNSDKTNILFASIELKGALKIPVSVSTIENNAFAYCDSISSLTIPNSVASIGEYAFKDCTELTSITIGHSIAVDNSLTKIGNYAFAGCNNLLEVRSYIMNPMTVGTSVFSTETIKNGTLHIPVGTLDLYKSAGGWNQFTNIMEDRVITGVDEVTAGDSTVSVYNLGGVLLRRDCPREELSSLPHGVYIIVSGSTHIKIKI